MKKFSVSKIRIICCCLIWFFWEFLLTEVRTIELKENRDSFYLTSVTRKTSNYYIVEKVTLDQNMVFCYKNCSDLLWEKILRWLKQFVQIVKGQYNFWQQNAFLTCSWRFLRYNKLEQLELKLEKIIGIKKHAEKVKGLT